jgi:proline racemase
MGLLREGGWVAVADCWITLDVAGAYGGRWYQIVERERGLVAALACNDIVD